MPVDYNRALVLLSVVEKALGHPQLRPIVDLAQLELTSMTKDAAQAVKDLRAEEAKKAEQAKAKPAESEVEEKEEDPKPAPVSRRL